MKILYHLKLFLVFALAMILTKYNIYSASYFFTYNGHSYEIVDQKKNWTDAASYATGKGGYLVQIENSGEQSAIWTAIISGAQIPTTYTVVNDGGGVAYIWIGATDKSTEGIWLWDGENDNSGANFWKGQGLAGKNNGEVVNGGYNNWGGSSIGNVREPDDFNSNQDAAAIALEPWPKNNGGLGKSGEWNDLNLANQLFFIVEYDNPTSVGELNNIKTYPNPLIDDLYFDNISSFKDFKIYDLMGNLIIKGVFDDNLNYKIGVSNFNSGSYLLVLSNEFKSWSSIIIKE